MTEIKRYGVSFVKQDDDSHAIVVMSEQLKGDWVRWEDVKDLIAIADDVLDVFKEYCGELSRAMASEDILNWAKTAPRESMRPGVINGPSFVDQNELSLKERAK